MDEDTRDLVQIEMLDDEVVGTTKGPARFTKGQKPWVVDWVAVSLVGRGMARYVDMEKNVVLPEIPENLSQHNMPFLRKLAMEYGIDNYHMKRKDELIGELEALRMDADARPESGGKLEEIHLVPPGTELIPADEESFIED